MKKNAALKKHINIMMTDKYKARYNIRNIEIYQIMQIYYSNILIPIF